MHVRDGLSVALPARKIAEAELLASELVSNAVLHAGLGGKSTILLEIDVGTMAVRVSVVDGGAGFGATNPNGSPHSDEGGWGLFLVEEMSDRWGVDTDPHGVWFEIDRESGR